MKQRLSFGVVCLLLAGALVATEVRRVDAPVGPQSILYFIADSQRELTRLPMVYTRIPDAQEVQIGNSMARMYGRGGEGGEETAAIQKYVRRVGDAVARRAARKLPYQFHYIPDMNFVHAFALPGGHVYIGGGMLLHMRSEDELAAVLGHEIEHIDHYHCVERLQWESGLRKIPLGGAFRLPVRLFQAGYTKEQEFEADREGTALAVAAGYSPRGAVLVFEEFEKLQREVAAARARQDRRAKTPAGELSRVALDILTGYFRSHPATADRKARIAQAFAAEIAARTELRPLEYAHVFLTYRAGQAFDAARASDFKLKATRERFEEAIKLANESLALRADQPAAWRVIGQAQLALGEISAADEIYKKLVGKYPQHADAIRGFADNLTAQALQSKRYEQARKYVLFSLTLQPNHSGGLKTLAQVQLALDDLAGAEATCVKLKNLYPTEVQEVAAYAAELGRAEAKKLEYTKAVRLLELALRLERDRVVLVQLADTHFARGSFAEAAAAYRRLLAGGPADLRLIQLYAESLGATGRPTDAVREFADWLSRARLQATGFASDAQVELAGLQVLAGDRILAERIRALGRPEVATIAPESMGRLAHWYARAGDARTGMDIALGAVRQRPGVALLQNELGWACLGQRDFAQAEEAFARATSLSGQESEPATGNSRKIGWALGQWGLGRSTAALSAFDSATEATPQWLNPTWVRALYPGEVTALVAEIRETRKASEQFFDANFSPAAATARKFAEKFPADPGWVRRYSTYLSGAGKPDDAVRELKALLQKAPPASAEAKAQGELDLTGLTLLAGDGKPAEDLLLKLQGERRLIPENGARLAWWHYRTGKTPLPMENALRALAHTAPDDAGVQSALGWVELERGNYKAALERFAKASSITREQPGAAFAIGRAVALWRTGPTEHGKALDVYEAKAEGSPYWRKAAWVQAMTPSTVAATLTDIEAALVKRIEERKKSGSTQP